MKRIVLPDEDELAAKYVREAVEAYPELYFSRFVVLGEGLRPPEWCTSRTR